jgi:hypothetical protein
MYLTLILPVIHNIMCRKYSKYLPSTCHNFLIYMLQHSVYFTEGGCAKKKPPAMDGLDLGMSHPIWALLSYS